MTEQPQNGLVGWLKQNAWGIIILVAGVIIAYTTLSVRVSAMEIKLAKYPSEDYFDLKFTTIERDLSNLGSLLQKHVDVTK